MNNCIINEGAGQNINQNNHLIQVKGAYLLVVILELH